MVYLNLTIIFQKRQSIDLVANRQTDMLTWVGLGLMSVQFGILARLTWWEYSWDIMEPVTYFVTYGTAMAVYAYYVLTKQVWLSRCFQYAKTNYYHLHHLKTILWAINFDFSTKDPISEYSYSVMMCGCTNFYGSW